MLEEIFSNEITYWLFGTAIIFTFVGRFMAFHSKLEDVIAATIDSLIDEGYIKTKGEGKTLELVKHRDWEKECHTQD